MHHGGGMIFPHNFVNKIPVIEIEESNTAFSDLDAEDFCRELIEFNVHSAERIAFDLTEKKYFTSAELGILIKIKDTLLDQGIDLVLINPSEKARELLKMVGVFDLFMLVEDAEEMH
jgi:anti-anti-sigma factor